MMVYTYNPSTQEAEARRLQVPGQPGLHSKTLSQKTGAKTKQNKKIEDSGVRTDLGSKAYCWSSGLSFHL
jgi:hypothetical protein